MTGWRGREIWLVVDEMSRAMIYEEMNESHLALFGARGNAGVIFGIWFSTQLPVEEFRGVEDYLESRQERLIRLVRTNSRSWGTRVQPTSYHDCSDGGGESG